MVRMIALRAWVLGFQAINMCSPSVDGSEPSVGTKRTGRPVLKMAACNASAASRL